MATNMSTNFHEFREAVLSANLQKLEGMGNLQELVNSRGIFPRLGGRWTTALIFSVQQNMLDMVKFLLKVPGIDVNLIDPTCSRTAFHWAAFHGYMEMVNVLVNMPNIKMELKDLNGKTAQSLAGADAEITCRILTAINDDLKKKLDESKDENINVEEVIEDMQNYGKQKLKSTLETFNSKKRKHQAEVVKLEGAIVKVKKCIDNVDPGETLRDAKKDFECPICLENMEPPKEIWQCDAGHTLCGDCIYHPSIHNCPTCKRDITSRNRAMENLYNTLF